MMFCMFLAFPLAIFIIQDCFHTAVFALTDGKINEELENARSTLAPIFLPSVCKSRQTDMSNQPWRNTQQFKERHLQKNDDFRQAIRSEVLFLTKISVCSRWHTGVLISKHWIVSAANLIFSKPIKKIIVESSVDFQKRSIQFYVVHNEFKPETLVHNIALVKLKNEIQYTPNAVLIVLPKPKDLTTTESKIFANYLCNGQFCSSMVSSHTLMQPTECFARSNVSENEICAEKRDHNIYCSFTGGAVLTVSDNRKRHLVLVGLKPPYNNKNSGHLRFLNINYYTTWINHHVKKQSEFFLTRADSTKYKLKAISSRATSSSPISYTWSTINSRTESSTSAILFKDEVADPQSAEVIFNNHITIPKPSLTSTRRSPRRRTTNIPSSIWQATSTTNAYQVTNSETTVSVSDRPMTVPQNSLASTQILTSSTSVVFSHNVSAQSWRASKIAMLVSSASALPVAEPEGTSVDIDGTITIPTKLSAPIRRKTISGVKATASSTSGTLLNISKVQNFPLRTSELTSILLGLTSSSRSLRSPTISNRTRNSTSVLSTFSKTVTIPQTRFVATNGTVLFTSNLPKYPLGSANRKPTQIAPFTSQESSAASTALLTTELKPSAPVTDDIIEGGPLTGSSTFIPDSSTDITDDIGTQSSLTERSTAPVIIPNSYRPTATEVQTLTPSSTSDGTTKIPSLSFQATSASNTPRVPDTETTVSVSGGPMNVPQESFISIPISPSSIDVESTDNSTGVVSSSEISLTGSSASPNIVTDEQPTTEFSDGLLTISTNPVCALSSSTLSGEPSITSEITTQQKSSSMTDKPLSTKSSNSTSAGTTLHQGDDEIDLFEYLVDYLYEIGDEYFDYDFDLDDILDY